MSVMKTSLTIIPMCPRELLSHYKKLSRLILCYKRIGPPCCTLFTLFTCSSLQFILSQNYLSPTISVLAEKTLLKTAYHFLLLLVGFDTLTYRKDYDRSPILVGHQDYFLAPLPCGMYIPMKMIGFRCLARSHTAPAWVPGGPIPDDLWVVWEGHPIAQTHLATVPNAVAKRG